MDSKTKVALVNLLLEPQCDEAPKETKLVSGNGSKKIVILQRGWVFVGDYFEEGTNCRLENASCIRNWGTTKGLGELAENGPTSSTKLDPTPTVRFHKLGVVATLDCSNVWKK